MTVTVTTTIKEGYSLYEDKRGINTISLPYKTNSFERGGVYYPNTLEEARDDGIELPFSDYCQKLAAADCNLLRVKWSGKNENNGLVSIEPPPYGTFNIWHSILDPTDIATYRSDQVTYPIDAGTWASSNMKEFLDQCAAYNVYLHVILFGGAEFGGGWKYHAWNADNYYVNGLPCAAADQGFLADVRDIYDDATAIQAAKDRVDFIVDAVGSSKAVVSWELYSEMTWDIIPDFWEEPGWNDTCRNNIRNKVNPWVTTIGNYLRAADPYNRPIAIGLLRPPAPQPDGTIRQWPSDPDAQANVQNEPMVQYPIDIVCMNDYEGSIDRSIRDIRLAHEYTDKLIWVTQFSPTFTDISPRNEDSPYTESIKFTWVPLCGDRWGLTPLRWPGLIEREKNYWLTGGYADSDLYSIPSVTKTFAENVGWNANWDVSNGTWYQNITSAGTVVTSGTARVVAYGEPSNSTMLLEYSTVGSKTIDVNNVTNGAHTFTYYDWTDGSVAGTVNSTAVGGSLSLSVDVTAFQDNMIVAHLIKD